MSDSDTADQPSDAIISRALRDIVIATHKAGKHEDVTVKRVRAKVEEQLGLGTGFFKTRSEWKQKSERVIHEAFDKYCGGNIEPEPEPKPKPKSKPARKKTTNPKTIETGEKIGGLKRRSAAPAKKPQKRRKTTDSPEDESMAALSNPPAKEDSPSDAESEPPTKLVRRTKKVVTEGSDGDEAKPNSSTRRHVEDEDNDERPSPAVSTKGRVTTSVTNAKSDESDSDMSSLIDEPPMKKKSQKKQTLKKGGKGSNPKPPTAAKPKVKLSKAKDEDNPDKAEIKRLQSWLVKCGVRKVWVKELANCETSKEKINHLKGMLKDVGMDGKYSNEKAAAIKERREFAKDLEAIQEGAKVWGEAPEDSGRPRRRFNRVAQKPIPRYEEDDDDHDAETNDVPKDAGKANNHETGSRPAGGVKVTPRAEDDDSDEADFEVEPSDSDEVSCGSGEGSDGDESE